MPEKQQVRNPSIRKSWIDLADAAALVGRRIGGSSWKDDLLKESSDSDLLVSVRSELIEILASGAVSTLIDDGSGPVSLKCEEVEHYAFRLDIISNSVSLNGFDRPFQCSINRLALEKYLTTYASSRADNLSAAEKQNACLNWLREQMSYPKIKPKTYFKREAIARFAVSERAFNRLWEIASEEHLNWRKPGRLKSTR